MDRFFELTEETFVVASANLSDEEVLGRIQHWINEDRSSSAVQSLENVYSDLAEVLDAHAPLTKTHGPRAFSCPARRPTASASP